MENSFFIETKEEFLKNEKICLVVPKNMIKKADMMLKMCGLYQVKLIAFEDLLQNPKMLESMFFNEL